MARGGTVRPVANSGRAGPARACKEPVTRLPCTITSLFCTCTVVYSSSHCTLTQRHTFDIQSHPPFVFPAHKIATDRTASKAALNLVTYEGMNRE